MGITKTSAYEKDKVKLAKLIKAIAHPARLAILEHLLGRDSCMCGDIVDEMDLAQATVSQHLKELKQAGIIRGTIEGRNVCYCIDQEKYNEMKELLNDFLRPCAGGENCC